MCVDHNAPTTCETTRAATHIPGGCQAIVFADAHCVRTVRASRRHGLVRNAVPHYRAVARPWSVQESWTRVTASTSAARLQTLATPSSANRLSPDAAAGSCTPSTAFCASVTIQRPLRGVRRYRHAAQELELELPRGGCCVENAEAVVNYGRHKRA
jgi:hypothetical protein